MDHFSIQQPIIFLLLYIQGVSSATNDVLSYLPPILGLSLFCFVVLLVVIQTCCSSCCRKPESDRNYGVNVISDGLEYGSIQSTSVVIPNSSKHFVYLGFTPPPSYQNLYPELHLCEMFYCQMCSTRFVTSTVAICTLLIGQNSHMVEIQKNCLLRKTQSSQTNSGYGHHPRHPHHDDNKGAFYVIISILFIFLILLFLYYCLRRHSIRHHPTCPARRRNRTTRLRYVRFPISANHCEYCARQQTPSMYGSITIPNSNACIVPKPNVVVTAPPEYSLLDPQKPVNLGAC
uniref:Uncharacterized protein n=1 Tax=Strigamia maritima TaxID=126957 RepID=T1IQ02_STRMM